MFSAGLKLSSFFKYVIQRRKRHIHTLTTYCGDVVRRESHEWWVERLILFVMMKDVWFTANGRSNIPLNSIIKCEFTHGEMVRWEMTKQGLKKFITIKIIVQPAYEMGLDYRYVAEPQGNTQFSVEKTVHASTQSIIVNKLLRPHSLGTRHNLCSGYY